jgi:hypothetical protein
MKEAENVDPGEVSAVTADQAASVGWYDVYKTMTGKTHPDDKKAQAAKLIRAGKVEEALKLLES